MRFTCVPCLVALLGLSASVFAAPKTADGTLEVDIYFDSAEIMFGDGFSEDAFEWGFEGLEVPYVDVLTSGVFRTDIGDGTASGSYEVTVNGQDPDSYAFEYGYLLPGDVITITYAGQAMSETPDSTQNVSVVVDLYSSFDISNVFLQPEETLTLWFSYDYNLETMVDNALPLPGGTTVGADAEFVIQADTVSYWDPSFINTAYGDLLDNTPTSPSESNGSAWDAVFGYEDYFGEIFWNTSLFVGVSTESLETLAGDANGDGQVDGNDLISVEENFGATGEPGIAGDANGDGQVDGNDLISVEENFGATASQASAIPEPATLALLLGMGGVGVMRRKRR